MAVDGAPAVEEEELDPKEKRKRELEEDEDFKKYIKFLKIKIPLVNIKRKMKEEGLDPDDIDLFADSAALAKYKMDYG
jgi:hypothetical protein